MLIFDRTKTLFAISCLFFFLPMGQAFAYTCTPSVSDIKVTFPAMVVVSPDASVGTLLTPWTDSTLVNFNCRTDSVTQWVGVSGWSTMNPSGSSVSINRSNYVSYKTNIDGVGIIARTGGSEGNTTPVGVKNTSYWASIGQVGAGMTRRTFDEGVTFALVKISSISAISGGVVAAGRFGTIGTASQDPLTSSDGYRNYRDAISISYSAVRIATTTCRVSNTNVSMGSLSTRELPNVGSVGPAKNFNVAVTGCDDAINRISINLTPVTAILSSGGSDIALSGSSTARGIGIRLMDASGVALQLNTDNPISYTPKTGSAVYAMRAAYVRTAATVVPGSANSSIVFTMSYQ